ncbi:MAG: thioesterase family protein [Pseudomonadota bacterium]
MTTFLTPLPISDLRDAGVPDPFTFGQRDRVRFGELDVLGHVNNAAYLAWFENFRIHYFRDYGVSEYRGTPPRIVLRNIGLEFLSEVLLNDEYIVAGRTRSYRTTSFEMEYVVVIGQRITTRGSAVIVNLDQAGAKQPLPDAWKDAFRTRDGARQA